MILIDPGAVFLLVATALLFYAVLVAAAYWATSRIPALSERPWLHALWFGALPFLAVALYAFVLMVLSQVVD